MDLNFYGYGLVGSLYLLFLLTVIYIVERDALEEPPMPIDTGWKPVMSTAMRSGRKTLSLEINPFWFQIFGEKFLKQLLIIGGRGRAGACDGSKNTWYNQP